MGLLAFLAPLAIVTSTVVLVLLIAIGDVGPRRAVVLGALLLAAGYAQFLGGSILVVLAGLGCQTVLALYLLVRWQLTA